MCARAAAAVAVGEVALSAADRYASSPPPARGSPTAATPRGARFLRAAGAPRVALLRCRRKFAREMGGNLGPAASKRLETLYIGKPRVPRPEVGLASRTPPPASPRATTPPLRVGTPADATRAAWKREGTARRCRLTDPTTSPPELPRGLNNAYFSSPEPPPPPPRVPVMYQTPVDNGCNVSCIHNREV